MLTSTWLLMEKDLLEMNWTIFFISFLLSVCMHIHVCLSARVEVRGHLARVGSLFLPCMFIRTLACVHSNPVPCQSHLPLPRCRVDLLARNQHLLLRTVSHTGRTANFFCSEKARPPGLQSMCSSRGYQNTGTCLYLAYPRAVGALSGLHRQDSHNSLRG